MNIDILLMNKNEKPKMTKRKSSDSKIKKQNTGIIF